MNGPFSTNILARARARAHAHTYTHYIKIRISKASNYKEDESFDYESNEARRKKHINELQNHLKKGFFQKLTNKTDFIC